MLSFDEIAERCPIFLAIKYRPHILFLSFFQIIIWLYFSLTPFFLCVTRKWRKNVSSNTKFSDFNSFHSVFFFIYDLKGKNDSNNLQKYKLQKQSKSSKCRKLPWKPFFFVIIPLQIHLKWLDMTKQQMFFSFSFCFLYACSLNGKNAYRNC